jgi:hypothetical protein
MNLKISITLPVLFQKLINMNIDDVPADVQRVWVFQQYGGAVGIETWEEAESIIKANPKYFPWETKYQSIPKEIHDAYWKEKQDGYDDLWAAKDYKGIIPALMEPNEAAPAPLKPFMEAMVDMFKAQEDRRKRDIEYYEKEKSLWDKYYNPFGLEFRKQKPLI